jgi:anti-sigma factor RsiW
MSAAHENNLPRSGGPGGRACEGLRPLLVPYLDGEVSAEEARLVEAHLSECASCARDFARHRRISDALAIVCSEGSGVCSRGVEAAREAPGPGSRLAHAVRGRARRSLERRTWAARVAAAVLVAGGILWLFHTETPAPSEDLLTHLEVLEDLEDGVMEPSQDLVQVLLDTVNSLSEPRVDELLEADLAEEVLTDELFPEKS